jgi:ribosomal protein L31E
MVVINIRRNLVKTHSSKRVGHAAGYIRKEVARLYKARPEDIFISIAVNQILMARGSKVMGKIDLDISSENGKVTVKPATPKQVGTAGTSKKEAAGSDVKKNSEKASSLQAKSSVTEIPHEHPH